MKKKKKKRKGADVITVKAAGAAAPVKSVPHDNVAVAFDESLVPEKYRGTDKYLDVVQWNLEWFGAGISASKDTERIPLVTKILSTLNADIFVLQEVAGPSEDNRYKGALDGIAEELTKKGAGDYRVFYTKAGGQQRCCVMYDSDFIRAKSAYPAELFERGTYKMPDGKTDAFAGRTPIYGYFNAYSEDAAKFDFQLLGVHLKAMTDGAPQRKESANVLKKWMEEEGNHTDTDILIMGDFNAPPGDDCWQPFHKMEDEGKVKFREINDNDDFSYLWLKNKSDKYVSRIDLTVMSSASSEQVAGEVAKVVAGSRLKRRLRGRAI
ncbi:MAG: endonuclease/exonuclease/phosphatase family protein [Bacteroidota bacterium]